MQYIQGSSRHQTYFSTLENQVGPDNPIRLIDGFVDKLHLQKLGFFSSRWSSLKINQFPNQPEEAPLLVF
jgi:hypothetical protein